MRPRASVVVPTYQRRASVLRLLAALRVQSAGPEAFEAVVVIDGSTDDTWEAVASVDPPYSLRAIRQSNRGRAAACNAGVREATADLVILLDDDMEPAPGFVDAHLEAHGTDEPVAVLGAVPVHVGSEATSLVRYTAARFQTHLRRLAEPGRPIAMREFYTGNFSIQRGTLVDVGGFDESFTRYGHEDLELSLRLRAAGVRLAYAPEAVAVQHYEKSFARLALDAVAEGRTALVLLDRHPGAHAELKLGAWASGPLRHRALRRIGLWFGLRWPAITVAVVVRITRVLERMGGNALTGWYPLAHGYLYWIGVAQELRERGGTRADFHRLTLGQRP